MLWIHYYTLFIVILSDGDVTECRMDDDEELKNQCFGGDYSGEVHIYLIISQVPICLTVPLFQSRFSII